MKTAVLDIETRSLLDLRKVGAARYARHGSTSIWCVGYAVDDDPVQLWLPGEPVPPAIIEAVTDPDCVLVGHNSNFEHTIWKQILTPRYGWPNVAIEKWRCTMAMALALALPPKLAKLAVVLGLKHQKADDKIMRQVAKPRRPRGDEDPAGTYWFDDEKRRQQLHDYCRQDVACERELYRLLPPLIPAEQELWCLDQVINSRGFYTDGLLIEKAIAISTAAERAIADELRQITNGAIETPGQVDKLLAWLSGSGCTLADLQKPTVAGALRRTDLSPIVRRVLELRSESAHAAANKFPAMRAWRCTDGRIRGAFKFHGAATGRWSAGGPQPQNFRKEEDIENIAAKFNAVMAADIEKVRALGMPLAVIGDLSRTAICAPPGYRLMHGDYSAIESRVTAWIADETGKLAQWKRFDESGDPHDDPYYQLGRALGFPEEKARAAGKIADLAFGYGGGIGAYKNFASEDDTASDLQIEGFKRTWREQHPQTVQFWYGIERAAVAAVHRPLTIVPYGRLKLECRHLNEIPFLFIRLPSGRELSYPFAKLIRNARGNVAVSFMDNAIVTGGWTEYRPGHGAWGGVFTENIVQGIARDHLAAALRRLEAAGYPVVLHVHDGIACEVPDGADNVR
jgi:DNA polymerase